MSTIYRRALLGLALSLAGTAAIAQSGDYCAGYRAGWGAAFRNRNMPPAPTPPCPPAPPGQHGSFEAGFEAGMLAALQEIGGRRY